MTTPAGIHRDWFDRTWSFAFPSELYPEVIERLRGTLLQLEAAVVGLVPAVLARRLDYEWSIQENVGHLGDLDELFRGRIDDFLSDTPVLSPADMSNQTTSEADHNARPLAGILEYVHNERSKLVARLEALDPEGFARSAYHERLDTQMRLVDQCIFQATHDDYHLAIITQLKRAQVGI